MARLPGRRGAPAGVEDSRVRAGAQPRVRLANSGHDAPPRAGMGVQRARGVAVLPGAPQPRSPAQPPGALPPQDRQPTAQPRPSLLGVAVLLGVPQRQRLERSVHAARLHHALLAARQRQRQRAQRRQGEQGRQAVGPAAAAAGAGRQRRRTSTSGGRGSKYSRQAATAARRRITSAAALPYASCCPAVPPTHPPTLTHAAKPTHPPQPTHRLRFCTSMAAA